MLKLQLVNSSNIYAMCFVPNPKDQLCGVLYIAFRPTMAKTAVNLAQATQSPIGAGQPGVKQPEQVPSMLGEAASSAARPSIVYAYPDSALEEWEGLRNASSPGAFFAKFLRKKPFVKQELAKTPHEFVASDSAGESAERK